MIQLKWSDLHALSFHVELLKPRYQLLVQISIKHFYMNKRIHSLIQLPPNRQKNWLCKTSVIAFCVTKRFGYHSLLTEKYIAKCPRKNKWNHAGILLKKSRIILIWSVHLAVGFFLVSITRVDEGSKCMYSADCFNVRDWFLGFNRRSGRMVSLG